MKDALKKAIEVALCIADCINNTSEVVPQEVYDGLLKAWKALKKAG